MDDEYDYESLGSNTTMAHNALAGALAGIAEHCAMYPVDSIKTRMQVIQSSKPVALVSPLSATATATATATITATTISNPLQIPASTIRSTHSNLWRGVTSVVMGAGPAHALHFGTYEFCKDFLGANKDGHQPLASAAAGACATLAHDALMNPFDVIKQRMQLKDSVYRTVRECARQVYTKEGAIAFYVSLPTTLTMSIPFQSIQFATYEYFRKTLNPSGEYDPKTHVIAGGLAGAFASSITTPLDVIKTLLQTRGSHHDPYIRNTKGLVEAALIIKERFGLKGFFRGFRPRVLTHMPSAAISWSVYEYFKWILNARLSN